MKFLNKENMTAKERKRALIQAFLGLMLFALLVAVVVWGGVLSLKVLGMTLTGTAKQYSIPQDVVDGHRKIFMLHLSFFGICVFAITIITYSWILPLLRETFYVLRKTKPRIREAESGK